MSESTVFITGATDGLGRATAARLATMGHQMLLHGRNEAKLSAVADDLEHRTGERPKTFVADFAELAQVRRLAIDVQSAAERIDVLVNNAGVGFGMTEDARKVSDDGYELHFAVNYLAGFLLTNLLLDVLAFSAPARIIHIASRSQEHFDCDDLQFEHGYTGKAAYGRSKLATIASGFELASKLDPEQITVNSVHPGTYMPTKIVLQSVGLTVDPLETGIEAVTNLVNSPELEGVSGKFFDRTRPERPDPLAYDLDVRARLWDQSLALTRLPK